MTVRAYFDPPKITLGGLPAFSVGPKSSVVLSDVPGRGRAAGEKPRVVVCLRAKNR